MAVVGRVPNTGHFRNVERHEVKGPVMDRLADTEFLKELGSERVFLTTQDVYEMLATPPVPHPRR